MSPIAPAMWLLLLPWGAVAGIHLVNGFRTGLMKCAYAGSPGEALRDERPARYWVYAAVNVFTVLLVAALLWLVSLAR